MTGVRGARRVLLPVVGAVALVLLVMAVAHGVHRPGSAGDAYRRAHPAPTAVSSPRVPKDFRCPGEDPSPSPTGSPASDGATAQPGDHYAENHGFRVPFPLHGQRRCDGLAAVRQVEHALRPLRERGDFTAKSAQRALVATGFPDGGVRAQQDSGGVYFLVTVDETPLCVEGALYPAGLRADAFGGYPDHVGCDLPSGGH
ncbi:hypothetical protein [Streptomyces longispororuber]|uniref:hypothetical protein n=1 Tax=Streptomyces longispororuber TaxID=68230 RepID=UPI00210C79E2|nr:hypothetical protein [Streptomyces longispororuber]MCQ4207201.1 hypothetical protein [Streptomyces longispororuber]